MKHLAYSHWLTAWDTLASGFRRRLCAGWLACVLGGVLGVVGGGTMTRLEAAPGEPEGHAFFESRIRPVLLKHCFECHSADKIKGGLRLDYRGGFEKGGDSGELIDATRPENSLFLQTIRHEVDDQKMPKGEPKLSDGVIADLTRWIRMGMPGLPEKPLTAQEASQQEWAHKLAERRTHWAWQPVQNPRIPAVSHATWSRHPVDRFLFAKMSEQGLAPAGAASRTVLLRRMKIALLGLPPTPEEVEAFVHDQRVDAYERLVDRFLKDVAFGKNWAAHWLDLMRFGETGGYVRDYPIPEAWRYRDYVIRAFNQDLPYDRFVQEHLAGDLLPPRIHPELRINESPIGTGCMRLMEVSSTATDVALEEAQMLENQIDTIGKAFQGLTIACARCHDHKFDAISARDYYGMFGVLAGSRQSQRVIDAPEVRETGVAELRRLKGQIQPALVKAWQEDLERAGVSLAGLLREAPKAMVELGSPWAKFFHREKVDPADPGYALWKARRVALGAREGHWKAALESEQAALRRLSLERVAANDSRAKGGVDFSKGLSGWTVSGVLPETVHRLGSDFALAPSGQDVVERLVAPGLASDRLSRKHGAIVRSSDFPLSTAYVSLKVAGGDAAQVRLIQHNYQQMENVAHGRKVEHFDSRFAKWVTLKVGHQASWQGRRSYLEMVTKDDVAHFRRSDSGDRFFQFAAKDPTGRSWFDVERVVFHDDPQPPQDDLKAGLLLVPGGESAGEVQGWAERWTGHWSRVCGQALKHWGQGTANAEEVSLLNGLLEQGVLRNRLETLPEGIRSAVADYRRMEESLPRFQRAAGLVEEGAGFDAPVQRRGSPDAPGEAAARRYLEVVRGDSAYGKQESARLMLAQDLASAKNPLTARVMANRVWRWIFGQGIVSTVDNFGVMGERPSHPELLDHLAHSFVEQGWSVKELVRYLVTTQIFQAESVASEEAQRKDPANRLLTHMPLQRIRAEAVRDSLLAVSGQLDRRMYGYTGPADFGQGSGPANRRRGIYQYIKREAQDHLMVMFDAPEPSRTQGSRESSNVPGQSLLLLNNPFVHEQARAWAARDLETHRNLSLEARVELLFIRALCRKPTVEEIQSLVAFVQEQSAQYQLSYDAQKTDARLWTDVCHVLLNTKEFLYLQ